MEAYFFIAVVWALFSALYAAGCTSDWYSNRKKWARWAVMQSLRKTLWAWAIVLGAVVWPVTASVLVALGVWKLANAAFEDLWKGGH